MLPGALFVLFGLMSTPVLGLATNPKQDQKQVHKNVKAAGLLRANSARNKIIQEKWLYPSFLKIAQSHPGRLFALADNLFSRDRLRQLQIDAQYAGEWKHRMALAAVMPVFFHTQSGASAVQREKARRVLHKALLDDPALVVRDTAVEAIHTLIQASPGEAALWANPLQTAFLAEQNASGREGTFIRETILRTLRAASLPLTPRVARVALVDANPQVRLLADQWSGRAYQDQVLVRKNLSDRDAPAAR